MNPQEQQNDPTGQNPPTATPGQPQQPYAQPYQPQTTQQPTQYSAQQPQSPDENQNGQPQQPQIVYMTRPLDPAQQQMTPEVKQRHEDSKKAYPRLNLSEGEYVIIEVRRHPIGMVGIWAATIAVVLAIFAVVIVLALAEKSTGTSTFGSSINISPMVLVIPAVLISALTFIFGFVSASIYKANRFILTNESIIQHIQTSLFNMRQQTISLQSIEDASYSQDGIMSHMLNYGSIRLSTIGDEDTYRFHYTANPEKQIAILNNAVESFKNGRRVEG